MIDEESDFAIAQFLVNPFRAAREIDGRREIHERRILAPERPGFEFLSIHILTAAQLHGLQTGRFQILEKQIVIVVLRFDGEHRLDPLATLHCFPII